MHGTSTGTCDSTRERRPTINLIAKAKKFINDNPGKVRQGIDQIGDAIDKRTDGKYADKVDRVQQEAAKRLGGDATPNTKPDVPGTDAPKTGPNA